MTTLMRARKRRTEEAHGHDPEHGAPEESFQEETGDALDPDLRHRMISETAYRRYAERGYADGYDMEDWLEAEAEVDHILLDGDAEAAGSGTRLQAAAPAGRLQTGT